MLSRRVFVSWLSGVGAALGFGVRPKPGEATTRSSAIQPATVDAATIAQIAEVVLPSELGRDGFDRVGRDFSQWIAGYRAGAELVHGYGSTELRTTAPSPLGRWQNQLTALDQQSRQQHQRAFNALTATQRRDLVMAAINADRPSRLPEPLSANHVALAVVVWYFASPDAVDRCYDARIGRQQCRPLVNASRQPLPLANERGRAT